MNPRSLSFRLVAWYGGVLTIVFVLLGAVMYFDLRHFLESDLRATQLRRLHHISDTLLSRIQRSGEKYVIDEIHDRFQPEVNARFIRITRMDGSFLYLSGKPNDQSFDPAVIAPMQRPWPPAPTFSKLLLPDGKTMLLATSRYRTPENEVYLVEFGALLDPVQSMLDHLFVQLALGLPLAVAVVTGGGYLLVRRALRPVEQIANRAERISQHNLSERLPVSRTGDELERLSKSLNLMIARLEDAILNSKRFVADASHELRTPLTVLRGELESLLQDSRLGAETRGTMGSVLEEVERLAKIVEGLFALSRLDAGEAQAEWVPFDLAELAVTTTDQMSLLAEDKGISVSCQAGQPVSVQGDRARLKQVVVNLLDNAIKYTPSGGAIRLLVTRQNGFAVFEVADNGIGIPVYALPHVFDRFYRVDQSRSRDQGGAGLGLSIVKSICTAHGAVLEVDSSPGKGTLFRVKFPLAQHQPTNHGSPYGN